MKKIKLHLGCGPNYLEGYINIDKYDHSIADFNYDILNLPFDNNSVVEIYSSHLIEHLSYEEFEKGINEWFRILRKEGKLIMQFPDLIKCMQHFINNKDGKREYWRKTIYGLQTNEGHFHKNGFTFDEIKKTLLKKGFKKIIKFEGNIPRTTPSIEITAIK